MRITDLPELSAADLAEDDVVAVDHDTGNGIETRKFRVGKALADKLDKAVKTLADKLDKVEKALNDKLSKVGEALNNKLDKSGGNMTGNINFGRNTAGLMWLENNGDKVYWRPYVGGDHDIIQLVREPGDGSMPQGYGILNVDILDGKERIYAALNEKRDGYFPLSSIQKMDITNTLATAAIQSGTLFYFTLPEGYTVLNITLETVGWIGAVYATNIKTTSFTVFCPAVGSEPSTPGAYQTTAHISMYKTFG